MELPKCRLFLMGPSSGDAATAADCLVSAIGAGDVASILFRPAVAGASRGMIGSLLRLAQKHGVAAIIEANAGLASALGADGIEVPAGSAPSDVDAARRALPPGSIVGGDAGASRHAAMEFGEAGADYVVLDGASSSGDCPALWWADVSTIPCVAGGGVSGAEMHILARGGVEFVRVDGDWSSPDAMRRHIEEFAATGRSD